MTIEALSPQDALIAVMIAVSAVDQNMTGSEMVIDGGALSL